MKNLGMKFNGAATALVIAGLAATSANAQDGYTASFNGHSINCATLQGVQDRNPGGFTCGFVKEVEQYVPGPRLSCDTNEGANLSVMQPAGAHMRQAHGQPALDHVVQTSASLINSSNDAGAAVSALEGLFPGQSRNYYFTYAAVEGIAQRLQDGVRFNTAVSQVLQSFNDKNWDFPGEGNSVDGFERFLQQNPVVGARLSCLAQYPNTPWQTFER